MVTNNSVFFKNGGEFNASGLEEGACYSKYINEDKRNDLILIFNPFPDFTKEEVIKVIKSFRGLDIKLKWVKVKEEDELPKDLFDIGSEYPLVKISNKLSLAQIKYIYYVLRYFHEGGGNIKIMKHALELKNIFKNKHIVSLLLECHRFGYANGHHLAHSASYYLESNSPKPKSYIELMLYLKDKMSFQEECYKQTLNTTLESRIKILKQVYEKNRNS